MAADEEERALFVELLELEDDLLVGVLMGELVVVEMGELVGKIRLFA